MTHYPARRGLLAPALAMVAALLLGGAAQMPASAAPKVISPTGAPIDVEVSKGRLIQLDRPANSVFVADPDIADVQVKSPSLVYVFGKSAGETTLYAVGEREQVLLNATVVVHHNVERLEHAIHELVPRSAVSVSTVDDSLVIEGTVFSAAEGEDVRRLAAHFVPDPKQLINKMRVDAPNQVNIRVRVVEMSRSVVKEFGFNWQSFFSVGDFLIGFASGRQIFTTPSSAGHIIQRLPGPGGTGNLDNLFGSAKTNRIDANALLDALENQGLISVLAEPNLSAISGEPASFLAGGEFPIPVPQGGAGGSTTITIEFKKFGVSLNFVATITGGNRINLHVAPEVSQIDFTTAVESGGVRVPGLTTRRAATTIDLSSGQSFAIAGLLQNNVNQTIEKFPWLGDVPVLGALFRSTTFQRNESELVIIVTPYVVRPTQTANHLIGPTDGYLAPSDQNQIINGTIYRPQVTKQGTAPASRAGTTLIGPAGFDLD